MACATMGQGMSLGSGDLSSAGPGGESRERGHAQRLAGERAWGAGRCAALARGGFGERGPTVTS